MNPERRDYRRDTLSRDRLAADPFDQFQRWFKDAIDAGLDQPNAMALSTVGLDGAPDSRTVLLKGHGPEGFVFYTNLQSTKAEQLQTHGHASLLFHWNELERQVRVRGRVVNHDPAAADTYFAGRPRDAQLGAWASEQSRTLADRDTLVAAFAAVEARFPPGSTVPRPPFWGGLRVVADELEFWQGRANRLHDRFRFALVDSRWIAQRLAP